MDGQELAEQYRNQGYFIVVDAVEPDLLDLLETAAWRVVDKVRSGAVVDAAEGVRTGGEGVEPQLKFPRTFQRGPRSVQTASKAIYPLLRRLYDTPGRPSSGWIRA